MDALQMLRDDHKKVKALFKEFEDAEDARTKKRIVDEACRELEVHTQLEEEVFYPALRRDGADDDMMDEADEEHRVAKTLIEELKVMTPSDEYYDAKFTVLAENVKHHIDEEESEMLPKAAGAGMARMRALGEKMARRKEELLAAPPPRRKSAAPAGRASRATGATAATKRTTAATSRTITKGSVASTNGRLASSNGRAATGSRAAKSAASRNGRPASSNGRAAAGRRPVKTAAAAAGRTTTRPAKTVRRVASASGRPRSARTRN